METNNGKEKDKRTDIIAKDFFISKEDALSALKNTLSLLETQILKEEIKKENMQ